MHLSLFLLINAVLADTSCYDITDSFKLSLTNAASCDGSTYITKDDREIIMTNDAPLQCIT